MSNSSLVSYEYTAHGKFNHPRNMPILKITPHHCAGNLTFSGMRNIMNDKSRQMSCNYMIQTDGQIGLFCNEEDRSWCSSSPANDHQAITIEVANDGGAPDWHVSDSALQALLDLCVDICQRNGIKEIKFTGNASGNLTQHNYFSATACPGPYLKSKFPWLADAINERLMPSSVDTNAPSPPPQKEENPVTGNAFIDKIATWCQNDWFEHGILPSLSLAQAICESASGTSELAANANNLFGIKGGDNRWPSPIYNKVTKEYVNGQYVDKYLPFRKYSSWEESVRDHGQFLQQARYKAVVGEKNFDKAVAALAAAGYATSPTYLQTLKKNYQTYNLGIFDYVVNGETKSPVEPEAPSGPVKDDLYRVQCGAFKYKQNAEELVSKLRAAGFNCFIVEP